MSEPATREKPHAEALESIGIDVVAPLSGTATVVGLAPLRDPAVDWSMQGDATDCRLGEEFHRNGVDIRSGQVGKLASELRCPEPAGPLRRPNEVLQVVFSYG